LLRWAARCGKRSDKMWLATPMQSGHGLVVDCERASSLRAPAFMFGQSRATSAEASCKTMGGQHRANQDANMPNWYNKSLPPRHWSSVRRHGRCPAHSGGQGHGRATRSPPLPPSARLIVNQGGSSDREECQAYLPLVCHDGQQLLGIKPLMSRWWRRLRVANRRRCRPRL